MEAGRGNRGRQEQRLAVLNSALQGRRLLEGLYSTSKHQELTVYMTYFMYLQPYLTTRTDFGVARTGHSLEALDGLGPPVRGRYRVERTIKYEGSVY
jgi:hypothetical protein